MMIGFVRGQKLRLLTPPLAAGTYEALGARFVFETGEWAGLTKFAHFLKGEEHRILPIGADGEIGPHLNLSAGEWTVWVHGDAVSDGEVTARLTTETASLTVKETGAEDPLPLPPTYGEQVLAQVISLKEAAAEAVREGCAESMRRVGELLEDCEEALTAALAESREAVDSRLAENEAAVLAAAGVLRNRADGSLIPVWAGSEEELAEANPGSGTICLVDLL